MVEDLHGIGSQKNVGIWIRVSTEDQAQGQSPEHHERRARAYAEAKGWHVARLYDLSGVSGRSVMEHPQTQRMLTDIQSGEITGLIFSKLARLARNTRELLELADRFREHDAHLVSLQESIDTSSPAGRLFYTMIAAMAQWEREEIAERVAVSVPVRAKMGKSLGGAAPYGYRWKDKKLVPDPDEAPVRKLVHELFLELKRKKTVARALNDRGHRTRRGNKFSDSTIEILLRDPTAKGMRRANYTRISARKGVERKPESDWVWSKVEPVVSAEVWDACVAVLDEQSASRKPRTRRPRHLFAGVTFCACGGKMYVPSNSPKYICQTCRNKIPVGDLEAIFQEQLKAFFVDPQQIAQALAEGEAAITQKEELVRVLEAEEGRVQREMRKIYDLYMADKISKDGFGEAYGPLEVRLADIRKEIPTLRGELDYLKIQQLSSGEIVAEARTLYDRWEDLSEEEKRAIVEAITERIEIGEDEVAITLYYKPDPGAPPGGSGGGGPGGTGPPTTHSSLSRNSDNTAKNPSGLSVITEWPAWGTTAKAPLCSTSSTIRSAVSGAKTSEAAPRTTSVGQGMRASASHCPAIARRSRSVACSGVSDRTRPPRRMGSIFSTKRPSSRRRSPWRAMRMIASGVAAG
jgi:site-specific DNA recombinase